jgi:hypothetical protein
MRGSYADCLLSATAHEAMSHSPPHQYGIGYTPRDRRYGRALVQCKRTLEQGQTADIICMPMQIQNFV